MQSECEINASVAKATAILLTNTHCSLSSACSASRLHFQEANFKHAHKWDLGVYPKIFSKINFPICNPAYRYHCDRNPIATTHKDMKLSLRDT